jgi:hypothetical protein
MKNFTLRECGGFLINRNKNTKPNKYYGTKR